MGLFRNPELRLAAWSCFILGSIFTTVGFFLNPSCGIFAVALSLCFSSLFFLLMNLRYRKIQEISLLIDRILHGEELFDFAEFKEGELAILRDEIYKMTLRLKGQAEQLAADQRFLADSLADISHQLKTPLTALNLQTARLRRSVSGEGDGRRLLQEMQVQLQRIEWLVAVLLKLSRLDAGTISFQSARISAKQLLCEAAGPFFIPMEVKNQTFRILAEENAEFIGDTAWTAEAIGNIIKNCMEHTPQGGEIVLSAEETPLYLEIRIEDTGEGVPEEELPHLFERFYRGKNASSGSAGIGLAFAKTVIAAQNGSVQAKNRDGGGMCFWARFYKTTV